MRITVVLAFALCGCQKTFDTIDDACPKGVPGDGQSQADAVEVFWGSTLDGFTGADGMAPRWKKTLFGGAMQCVPGTGDLVSKHKFSSAQIHIEFATPSMPKAEGQERGNSGVYIQGRYELQVLDSYRSATYPDGQCGALYGQKPPDVNVCRPAKKWQAYDIIFHAAKFDGSHMVQRYEIVDEQNTAASRTRADLNVLVTAQTEQVTDRFTHVPHLERLPDARFDQLQNGGFGDLTVLLLDPHLCDGMSQVVHDSAFDRWHHPDSQNAGQQKNQDRLMPCSTACAHQKTCLTRMSRE